MIQISDIDMALMAIGLLLYTVGVVSKEARGEKWFGGITVSLLIGLTLVNAVLAGYAFVTQKEIILALVYSVFTVLCGMITTIDPRIVSFFEKKSRLSSNP